MQAVKRRRLSADAWAAMVEKFEASGLSAEVFCQQERVSLASLHWAAPGFVYTLFRAMMRNEVEYGTSNVFQRVQT